MISLCFGGEEYHYFLLGLYIADWHLSFPKSAFYRLSSSLHNGKVDLDHLVVIGQTGHTQDGIYIDAAHHKNVFRFYLTYQNMDYHVKGRPGAIIHYSVGTYNL